jgi:hypothetical protein
MWARPVCHPAWDGLGLAGGVVFSELSKMLIKSTPERTLLCGDAGSPQARLFRGAEMLRTGVIRHFNCDFAVCYTQVVRLASTDAFPVVGGDAQAERTARPSRAPWLDGPDVWYLPPQ